MNTFDPEQLELLYAQDLISVAIETFGPRLALVTSLQKEGMVVLDIASKITKDLRVVTLDTGRLPAETYEMMQRVREHYGLAIEIVFPDTGEVERMTTLHGPNLMYESVPNRNLCCQVRKVRPLERKMSEFDASLVGLRRSQGKSRENTPKVTRDSAGKWKISPLADWSREEIDQYTALHNVPVHPLYEQHYTSIGCGPCTRATSPGEDERAGRWWWELDQAKECGLHFTPDGKVERTLDVLLRDVVAAGAR
ncbi:MAG TPA: phosphoadenylyl-sulfate reductase [Bryobacteraceae bacterium]|nr:phosphoadenylyl-sulfate reductase [Bryobacteraceae bacterium]